MDLLAACPPKDRARIRTVITDLYSSIVGSTCIVGGIAIRYGLVAANVTPPNRAFNDLDLVAYGPEDFDPRLVRELFMVHHFHINSATTNFRFVFVHKATNTKVDVFHWKPAYLSPQPVPMEGSDYPLQSLATQLAVMIFDLENMRRRGPVDPKQLADAEAMWNAANLGAAEEVWDELMPGSSQSLSQALDAAMARKGSDTYGEKPWQGHPPFRPCAKCIQSPDWPLAPAQEIYDRLGYVEIDE